MSITGHQHLLVARAVRSAAGQGQDRVAAVRFGEGVVLAVADGSGGMRGGAKAADRSIQLVTDHAHLHHTGDERAWAALVARIDADAGDQSGWCALVIAAVHDEMITGASAGDCGAWLICDHIEDLTEEQVRKPLVGSGSAVPVPFRKPLGSGTLLLASDGLFKYARRKDIAQIALREDLDAAAQELILLPQLRSGDVPDDVSVVLCRAQIRRSS
jgi:PPM family protein phosphatase